MFGNVGPAITCEIGDDGTGFGFAHGTITGNIVDTNPGQSGIRAWGQHEPRVRQRALHGHGQRGHARGCRELRVAAGIIAGGNDINISGNTINILSGLSSTHGLSWITAFAQPVTATLDGSTNVITGVTEAAGGAQHIQNGDFVTGTGITTGTYILSGVGTPTWILSQPTTAPGTVTVNVQVTNQGMMVANNIIPHGERHAVGNAMRPRRACPSRRSSTTPCTTTSPRVRTPRSA